MRETIHDNFFDDFIVATATYSAIEDIPVLSGVYAFYHAFDFSTDSLKDQIQARLAKTVFKTTFSEDREQLDKTKRKFVIDTGGKPAKLSSKMTDFIKDDALVKQKRVLSSRLLACSMFQTPSYIGVASNLRARFSQHLDEDEGFFSKYVKEEKSDEFLFICLKCEENLARELESLLIQLCQPKFNTQRS